MGHAAAPTCSNEDFGKGNVALVAVVSRLQPWSLLATGVALAAAVPPFGILAYERWARRRGMLGAARQPAFRAPVAWAEPVLVTLPDGDESLRWRVYRDQGWAGATPPPGRVS